MNRERARELLPIIEAFANGEEIQFRASLDPDLPDSWSDLPEDERLIMTFPADDYEYRIKPSPREFFLYEGTNGWCVVQPNAACSGMIKVREVL